MTSYKLSAHKREVTGKKVKSLRKEKLIPAAIYEGPEKVLLISIKEEDIQKVINKAGTTSLIDINIENSKTPESVLIQEIQYSPRTFIPLHIGFHKVNVNEEIEAEVPVEVVGEAPAIKAFGGILVTSISTLTVRCLPTDIPHALTVDVSNLENIGDGITLKEISLPKGVELLHNDEEALAQTIITISAPQLEEEEPTPEVAPEDIELSVERGKESSTETASETTKESQ